MNDHKGADLMINALPPARELLTDRGYDSDGFRAALASRGITPCIPPRKKLKTVAGYDKTLYRQRHRIENIFGRLKDRRRIATRYDRCAHTCFSAICIVANVIFWLEE
jgi:putative transposase